MHVDRVTSDKGSNNASHALRRTDVPNLDVLIPATRNDQVGILADELGAEDTIRVAREATTTTLQSLRALSRLLVVDANLSVLATRQELLSVLFVIGGEQLVHWVVNLMKQATGSGVEVKQTSVGVGRDHYIFGNSRSL